MGDDAAAGAPVWLYEDGEWKLVDDPIAWGALPGSPRACQLADQLAQPAT